MRRASRTLVIHDTYSAAYNGLPLALLTDMNELVTEPRDILFAVQISRENLIGYIERANISYWGEVVDWDPATLTLKVVESDKMVECDDVADAADIHSNGMYRWLPTDIITILAEHWPVALSLMAEGYHQAFAQLMSDTGDMYTGDILIQLAAFRQEMYV